MRRVLTSLMFTIGAVVPLAAYIAFSCSTLLWAMWALGALAVAGAIGAALRLAPDGRRHAPLAVVIAGGLIAGQTTIAGAAFFVGLGRCLTF